MCRVVCELSSGLSPRRVLRLDPMIPSVHGCGLEGDMRWGRCTARCPPSSVLVQMDSACCLSLLQGDTCALAVMCCWVVCPRAGVGQVVSTPQGYRHPWSVCCLRFGVGNLVGQRFFVTGYCYFRAGELPVTYGGRK